MPNWCSTTIKFIGDPKQINKLYQKINEWTSQSYAVNGFGTSWLGNILWGANLQELIGNGVSCRGNITYIEDKNNNGDSFEIETETAWVPMVKMWYSVINKLELDSIKLTYRAEEPGCGVYLIYDPDCLGCFDKDEVYVDAYGRWNNVHLEDTICGYYDEADAISTLNEFFGSSCDNLGDIIKLCETFSGDCEDTWVYVHPFERNDTLCE